jgi:uncharacterized BrkB/YihY/UPF0761 family membrane protein
MIASAITFGLRYVPNQASKAVDHFVNNCDTSSRAPSLLGFSISVVFGVAAMLDVGTLWSKRET